MTTPPVLDEIDILIKAFQVFTAQKGGEIQPTAGTTAAGTSGQQAPQTPDGNLPPKPPWWPPVVPWPPLIAAVNRFGNPTGGPSTWDPDTYSAVFQEAIAGGFESILPGSRELAQADTGGAGGQFNAGQQEKPETFKDPETGQFFFRASDGGFRPFELPNAEDAMLSLQQQMDKAIVEGDFKYAAALGGILDRPTSQDVFDRALQFAKSPGDSFILNQIQRGLKQTTATPGDIRRLPKNTFLTQAFLDLTRDPFEAARLSQPLAPVREPISQLTDNGPIPDPQGDRSIPTAPATQIGSGFFPPDAAFTGPGGSGVAPHRLGQLAPASSAIDQLPTAQVQPAAPLPFEATRATGGSATADPFGSVGLRFPEDQQAFTGQAPGIIEPEPPPTGDFTRGPAPLSDPSTQLMLEEETALGGGPLASLAKSFFGTNDLQLSGGIEDLIAGREIQRTKPVLPALGLRTPTAGQFGRLSLREQAEFLTLAQLSGLTPEEVQREIRAQSPGAFGSQVQAPFRSR